MMTISTALATWRGRIKPSSVRTVRTSHPSTMSSTIRIRKRRRTMHTW